MFFVKTLTLTIRYTYMKSLLFKAEINKFRISLANFYSSMMLFTNYRPYFLIFSSANIDPNRFFALYTSLVTSFKLFETLASTRLENNLISERHSNLPTTWREVLEVRTRGRWLLELQNKF